MCSVDPDEVTEMTRTTETLDISRRDILCRKCEEAVAEVVLRVRDPYCRNCFLAYFTHKFRSTIGKSKQIRPGDQVLVGLSGGPSSTALLHLIKEGLQENSHKKLRFDPVFLYIDEGVVCAATGEDREHIHRVVGQVASLEFPCYVTALEQVMDAQPHPPALVPQKYTDLKYAVNDDLRRKFSELFVSCKSASAQQDLHDQLLQTLLIQSAQSLGLKKVFLGDNSTTLSVRILSQVALGRGSQLPTRVHFKTISRNIEVYRPMREILQDEILLYLRLRSITAPRPVTFQPKGPSITACTEEFIQGLQRDFPATIPTIFRTGDKLVAVEVKEDKKHDQTIYSHRNDDCCALCASNLDTEKGEVSALHATFVSQKHSSRKSQGISQHKTETIHSASVQESSTIMKNGEMSPDPGGGTCGCARGRGGCEKAIMGQGLGLPKTAERYLCYGCRITVRDLGCLELLPATVLTEIAVREKRSLMREQIQDFLL